MIKFTCDRCGKELSDIYYTIDIIKHEATSINQRDIFASNSITNNLFSHIYGKRQYCSDCKNAIENYMKEVLI